MDIDQIASLSRRERECLLLVHDGLASGEIARDLGIATETVESHIKNARAKLGGVPRRQAARLVAHAQHPQTLATSLSGTDIPPISTAQPEALREERSTFTFEGSPYPEAFVEEARRRNDHRSLSRLVLILVGLVALAMAILMVPAMADGFQRLANFIDPATN